ncbi:MAG: hypothetical protein ABI743_05635, partial [bacterium]
GFNLGNGGAPPDCCDMLIAQSTVPNPTSSTDWVISTVDGTGYQGQNNSMLDYQGRLVLAWNDATTGDLRVALANTTTPLGESDWLKYNIDAASISGYETDIQEVDGLLAISYLAQLSGLKYTRATTATPMSESDWVTMLIDPTGNCGNDADMTILNGKPAIAHRVYDTGDFRLAQATTATPTTDADWQQSVIEAAGTSNVKPTWYNGTSLGIAVSDGRLVTVYNDTTIKTLTFSQATVLEPTGPGDWLRYDLLPVGDIAGDLDLIESGGRLALAYLTDSNPAPDNNDGDLVVGRALTCAPASLVDWAFTPADPGTGAVPDVGYLPGICVIDNHFVVAHRVLFGINVTVSDGLW